MGLRSAYETAWQKLFDPRTVGAFLLGSVMLSCLGNGVYDMITSYLEIKPEQLWRLVLGFLLIFVLCVIVVGSLTHRIQPEKELNKIAPRPRRGLIFFVSQEDACRKAVEYHREKLELCWLICSTQTHDMARKLKDEFERTWKIVVPAPIVVNDVFDPLEFERQVLKIYDRLPDGWVQEDVIADYLGMTSHATAGVILAWTKRRFPLQYTCPVFDENRKAKGVADPIEIVLEVKGGPNRARVQANEANDCKRL